MPFHRLVALRLSEWISCFLTVVPPRSRRSFLELLCGCLISPEGWVTRALSNISLRCHWSTYYKLLERGSLHTQALAIAQVHWLLKTLPQLMVDLVIDDTLVLRHSTKAPGAAIRFDHSHKRNRPSYVLAQNWVGLALTLRTRSGTAISFPIRLRLVPSIGNTHKLKIAGALLRAFLPHIPVPVRLLTDAWFMRRRLLLPLLRQHGRFIGQVRKDTALFRDPPPRTSQRGRPRKYGTKFTPEDIAALPTEIVSLHNLREMAEGPSPVHRRQSTISQQPSGPSRMERHLRRKVPEMVFYPSLSRFRDSLDRQRSRCPLQPPLADRTNIPCLSGCYPQMLYVVQRMLHEHCLLYTGYYFG